MASRVERIRAMLEQSFAPQSLDVIDDSHKHAGHAGAAGGAGHFTVEIVSGAFSGQLPLARHRLVYAALASMMPAEIHALSIAAKTPDEAARRSAPAAG